MAKPYFAMRLAALYRCPEGAISLKAAFHLIRQLALKGSLPLGGACGSKLQSFPPRRSANGATPLPRLTPHAPQGEGLTGWRSYQKASPWGGSSREAGDEGSRLRSKHFASALSRYFAWRSHISQCGSPRYIAAPKGHYLRPAGALPRS